MQNSGILPFVRDPKLFVFRGRTSSPPLPEHGLAYRCWKETWQKVHREEMRVDHVLYSDDFSRQDIIVALFSGGACVGSAFMRFSNPAEGVCREDSYFRFWPPEAMNMILEMTGGRQLVLASYFTIAQEFRNKRDGICWKSLLLSLFLEKFLTLDAGIMITAARKMKSNEKLCLSLGAELIAPDIPFFINGKIIPGETADLVFWKKNNTHSLTSELTLLKERIWKQKYDETEINNFEVKNAA